MNATNTGSQDDRSLKAMLASMGMAALSEAVSLAQPNAQSDDIVVAGGTDISTEDINATHLCHPCFPGVVDV